MTDWNKETRDKVEAASAAGDEQAQAALRLHHRLDRIVREVEQLRESTDKLATTAKELLALHRLEAHKLRAEDTPA